MVKGDERRMISRSEGRGVSAGKEKRHEDMGSSNTGDKVILLWRNAGPVRRYAPDGAFEILVDKRSALAMACSAGPMRDRVLPDGL
jgi:hypothetical protein